MHSGIKIPYYKASVGDEEIEKVKEVINSGWLTTGKVGDEFEKKFAEYVGAKYCVLVDSCTSALFLSIKYLQSKLPFMKTAYLPSFTFAATANEAVHAGLEVTFGDVSMEDGCLVPDLVNNYDLVIPVHYAGNKADTDYGLEVVEDSAHSIDKNQCLGSNNLVCFSFYTTKNITMGEGGAICTNSEEAYNWFKQARHHGISKDGWNRYQQVFPYYDIAFNGWKYNISDIQAAIGLAQLEKLPEMDLRRRHIVDYYNAVLGYNHSGLHLYPIITEHRDLFIKNMHDNGISTSVHFLPLHQMTAFKNIKYNNLRNTEFLGKRVVSLPLYPGLSDSEVEHICQMTKKFM
jgi:dTDP-4-amino-4,6-dideoxygalactose transaminase